MNILKSYECLFTAPQNALNYSINAGYLMENFMNNNNIIKYSTNSSLQLIKVSIELSLCSSLLNIFKIKGI